MLVLPHTDTHALAEASRCTNYADVSYWGLMVESGYMETQERMQDGRLKPKASLEHAPIFPESRPKSSPFHPPILPLTAYTDGFPGAPQMSNIIPSTPKIPDKREDGRVVRNFPFSLDFLTTNALVCRLRRCV